MPDPKGLKVLHPFKGNQKQPGCQPDRHRAKFSVHSSPLCWGINIFYYAGPHAEFQESASLTATTCLPFKQKFSRVCIGCFPENIKRKKKSLYAMGKYIFKCISYSAIPSGLFCHLVLKYVTRRVKGLASQQILNCHFHDKPGKTCLVKRAQTH